MKTSKPTAKKLQEVIELIVFRAGEGLDLSNPHGGKDGDYLGPSRTLLTNARNALHDILEIIREET